MSARTRQIGHDGALHPCRHRHDRRASRARSTCCRSRARSPGSAGRNSRRRNGRGHVSSRAGGRGYLPRPWTGVASSQCRPCQPRPDEGDDGDRALPHGGARRPCRALREREVRSHHIAYNSLPQPALSEVPGRGGTRVAGRARGRAAAGAVLPRRVHAAGCKSPTSPTRTRP